MRVGFLGAGLIAHFHAFGLAESGEAVAAEAHARVTARLAASCVAGQVRMPAAVHLVTGGR